MFKNIFQNIKVLAQINSMSSRQTSSASNYGDYVKFLELVGNCKQIKRTGWVLRNVDDPETISGHMYRMSVMSFIIPKDSAIDRVKCMKLALIHDLAESIVGDITPYCGISREEKRLREHNAMLEICSLLDKSCSEEVLKLFEEYENQETDEAQLVKDFDLYDMILQAYEYEKRDQAPNKYEEFFINTKGRFKTDFVRKLVDELQKQREEFHENFTSNLKKENQSAS
ncbi:5'-deoxynucleotidase HDDC2 [Chironomus tepperi]|uniref:5'-deoxynucleotidase HDDC2 n=1 Tax=Chironomus tepperi TaxID=113505 RepID=UPI00391F1243